MCGDAEARVQSPGLNRTSNTLGCDRRAAFEHTSILGFGYKGGGLVVRVHINDHLSLGRAFAAPRCVELGHATASTAAGGSGEEVMGGGTWIAGGCKYKRVSVRYCP